MKKYLSSSLAAGILALSMASLSPAAVAQAPVQDPALQQRVTADEAQAPIGTKKVIDHGHADLGPMFVDGKLDFQVRDDSEEQPVWRHLEDVVFQVTPKAEMTLPENGQFDFTGAKPQSKVWVVPQTEIPGVVWLGWNTQSPSLQDTADRGVTLDYLGHQGPGQYTLFLQAGGFSQPQQLYNSSTNAPQSMWVDLNTHTHANWVFTEPGVHQIALRANVKQLDGTTTQSTKVLKFAVGVSPEDAASARWQGEIPSGAVAEEAKAPQSTNQATLWVGLGLLVVAAVIGGVAWWLQASAVKTRAKVSEASAGKK